MDKVEVSRIICTTLNRDPIKFEFSIAIVFGLIVLVGIVAYLAHGRLRGISIFPKGQFVAGATAVFTHVTNQMRIVREEIFGPVLCVIPYRNEAEVIAITKPAKPLAVFVVERN